MGTSSSYNGPNDNSPLLPPWADDYEEPDKQEPDDQNPDEENDDLDDKPSIDPWKTAKGMMTRYIRSKNQDGLRKVASSYLKAQGGSSGAAKSAIAGRSTAIKLGSFLSGISNNGIESTLESMELSKLIGESADVVMMEIADTICPVGSNIDESIARKAAFDVLATIYEKYELENLDITALDSMDKNDINNTMELYIVSYIYERWLNELGRRIEIKSVSETEAIRLEMDVKAYVKEAVSLDFANYDLTKIDFNSGDGREMIERIYQEAYMQLEVVE